MMMVRPVALEDCAAIARLAALADFGLTTLPKDEEALAKRVARSVADFEANTDTPEGESYLFVLEDSRCDSGGIAGTSGLISRVGGFEPFYMYRIEEMTHESAALDVKKEIFLPPYRAGSISPPPDRINPCTAPTTSFTRVSPGGINNGMPPARRTASTYSAGSVKRFFSFR